MCDPRGPASAKRAGKTGVMGRARVDAPPGPEQARRIRAIYAVAQQRGDRARRYEARGKPNGWLVVIIQGEESGRKMRGYYKVMDFIGGFDLIGRP